MAKKGRNSMDFQQAPQNPSNSTSIGTRRKQRSKLKNNCTTHSTLKTHTKRKLQQEYSLSFQWDHFRLSYRKFTAQSILERIDLLRTLSQGSPNVKQQICFSEGQTDLRRRFY